MAGADWSKTRKCQKIGDEMTFSGILLRTFDPRALYFVHVEFRCRGKWGTGTNRMHDQLLCRRHIGFEILADR